MKPIVNYKPSNIDFIQVGYRATVIPTNHPSDLVSNTKIALTTEVISYNKETGEFETLNTIYKPLPDDTTPSNNSCC